MKKHLIFTAIALLSITVSCKNITEKDKQGKADSETIPHHDHGTIEGVVLDNGKKWAANPETNQGIEAMIQLINNISPNENAEKLKTSLENEFQTIFQKCTMKGEAHEQLHNYLLPLKEKLNGINSPLDTAKINEIKIYLSEYQNYFK